MAKYGSCKFGQGKYGAGGTCTAVTAEGSMLWVIKVAWNGSTYVNEAQYARDLRIVRGNQNYITHSGGGFEPMQPGRAVVLFENIGGRFDASDSDSALYPNIRPGLKVLIAVHDVANSTSYPLFSGRIEDIRPTSGYELVEMSVVDDMGWIDGQDVTIADSLGITMRRAFDLVLYAADMHRQDMDDETQQMIYFGADRANAAGLLQMLSDACLGAIFVTAGGKFRFYSRAMNSSFITTHTLDQSVLLKNIQISQPWDNLRNTITVAANRWVKTSVHTIWTSPGGLLLAPSETRVFTVTFNNPSEVVGAEPNLDYTASEVGGTGVSSALMATLSVDVSNASTRGCTLTITNGATSSLWMSKLRLRGREFLSSYQVADPRGWETAYNQPVNNTISTKVIYTQSDSDSLALYGKRSFTLDNPFLQDANHAEEFAEILRDKFSTPSKSPVIEIETRPDIQFKPELLDKVNLTASRLGISNAYFVNGLEHRWLENTGQAVLTTLYLHDRVSSTDEIDNETLQIIEIPEIPDDPYPDVPIPGFPDFPIPYNPDDPYNTECLSKFRELPTGPYHLNVSGMMESNTESASKTGYFPCTLRSSENTYQSYAVVQGLLQSSVDSGTTWIDSRDWSSITVDFMYGDTALISRTGSSSGGSSTKHSFPAVPPTPMMINAVRATATGDIVQPEGYYWQDYVITGLDQEWSFNWWDYRSASSTQERHDLALDLATHDVTVKFTLHVTESTFNTGNTVTIYANLYNYDGSYTTLSQKYVNSADYASAGDYIIEIGHPATGNTKPVTDVGIFIEARMTNGQGVLVYKFNIPEAEIYGYGKPSGTIYRLNLERISLYNVCPPLR